MSGSTNPTESISVSFTDYVTQRTAEVGRHVTNGATDYSFMLDRRLHGQLSGASPLRTTAQVIATFQLKIRKHILSMQSVEAGVRQFPEIYGTAQDCARRLGIATPRVFIEFSPMPGAYTIASDQSGDLVCLTTGLIEALTPEELGFVIGHECGHIHNLHGPYMMIVDLLTIPSLAVLRSSAALSILTLPLQIGAKLFLFAWSRAAEVTADRAGLICCGDLQVAQRALAKLSTGGIEALKNISLDEYIRQISSVQASPVRLTELLHSHPLIAKRIEALRLFRDCSVLHDWRPEMRGAVPSRTIEAVDDQCEMFISVLNKSYEGFGQ